MEVSLPNQYYSPNSRINGGALFASFNSKDGSVYFKVLKQIANNPDKKNNFDGKNPINVKLSQDEAADIIRAIRTNSSCNFFHKFNDVVTTLKFTYYETEGNPPRRGFGATIKKDDTEVKIGFTLGSAERLSLFLQNALVHIFDAEYSQDLKEAKEYREKNKSVEGTSQSPETPTQESAASQESADF